MKISELMTRTVRTVSPNSTLQQAAKVMAEANIGAVPVADDERLVGMITDRDIAIRAVAIGLGAEAKVSEVMSGSVKYCYEDEDVYHVARNMADIQMRRLPVMNREKKLVGIVALGDLAASDISNKVVGQALEGISRHNSGARPMPAPH